MKLFLSLIISLLTSLTSIADFNWDDYYTITDIPLDKHTDPQIGGLARTANGDIIACFHRGEVAIYNEASKTWKTFASGLHEPLGIYVEEEGTILVIQRAELTRLHDKDKDGVADFYEVVCNDWGVSGNYHEFTFGLAKDSKKNIYITLGTASNGSGVREEIRGEWSLTGGLTQEDFIVKGGGKGWNEQKKKLPRMYSRVPYRGCVLQIRPGSMKAHVYATGLRTPNGVYMDDKDQLWVSDNQGDWLGASKIHRIEKGGFHGHPASLNWTANPPTVTPSDLPLAQLEAMRIKAAALLPQGDCGNSLTEITKFRPSFSPLSQDSLQTEQLLLGDMNHSRLVRYMPDVVNGKHQGTSSHIIDTVLLNHGNNRLLYTADGKSLYVGKTHLSWAGREGLKKITYNGKPYLLVENVKLTPKGFQFTFNAPIEVPQQAGNYKIDSYGIDYHVKYGSGKIGLQKETISSITTTGNTLTIELAEKPKPNKVYDIQLPAQITSALSDISSNRFWYTAHEVYDVESKAK